MTLPRDIQAWLPTLDAMLQQDGVLALQIFTSQTIENISGPNEINILLPAGSESPTS
ncbi:hypothetical protein [Mycobacteroides abscessus]|uniref:hypothetical protein n=1 Tax=Mycobacteroides abscessus TaxID=36809 RepID=UPI0021071A48|nr:hypothetical protein [Mycobacteroides abscessus]